jgi:DNA polymerase III sliding clamp (beta) subunit (PCNA family)
MELSLTKEQRLVAHAAGTKDYREVLNAVCVRGNKLIAADGFILAETELSEESKHEGADVLIPAAAIGAAKDIKGTGRVFINGEHEDEVTIIGDTSKQIVSTIKGNFPGTDQLYPKGEHVFRIGLAYDVLTKILKMTGKGNYLKLTFYGEEQPVKFEIPNNEIKGVAMPYKVTWEDTKDPMKEED